MHEDIEAIAERYGLAPEAKVALTELLERRTSRGSQRTLTAPDEEADAAEASPDAPVPLGPRYEDLGLIGVGGMGEVRRVRDRELGRVLAMKILRAELSKRGSALSRFVEEAQVTAQLEHPATIPVHEIGRLGDGRTYFTMTEVRGQTLTGVIREVHAASARDRWEAAPSGWTFARLVDAFRRVCECVAYAHARGVIHRDLKPDNVMVGAFGEVLVLDWGLAKIRGSRSAQADYAGLEAVASDRSRSSTMHTRVGTVAGTPSYMPPEQAGKGIDSVDATADVYSLGAVLYEILSGHAPYEGGEIQDILDALTTRPPAPLPYPQRIPEELSALCLRAMSRDPASRYPVAGEMAAEVVVWQEGARKRERALALVAEAKATAPRVKHLRARAVACDREAAQVRAHVHPTDPVESKRVAWALEDEAARLAEEAELTELRMTQRLQGALTHVPDFPEAHDRLADLYRQHHAAAEERRDRRETHRFEALLRTHDRGAHASYLRGDGRLSVETEPSGAQVSVFRYVERDRRLVPEFWRTLGSTPLVEEVLPMGSYLLALGKSGHETVRYPVAIGREEHWDGRRPDGESPHPIVLPKVGELGPNDIYVPGGWCRVGGDPEAASTLPRRRLWVDAFVMRRFPVTNREYIEFLDDLVAHGRESEARQHEPRQRGGGRDPDGAPVYGRRPSGSFVLKADSDGDQWDPDYPVLLVNWHAAIAFAAWAAERDGLPWRLPGEVEWEKSARGADARVTPWGDGRETSYACHRESQRGRLLPAVVEDYPFDESPYGLRGMGGNAATWCLDGWRTEGPPVAGDVAGITPSESSEERSYRGGAWPNAAIYTHVAMRRGSLATSRFETVGFRLARSFR